MAKQLIHIGIAVSTDGFLPGRANIINLAANVGRLGDFNINVVPQNGSYGESPFWAKHPVEYEALRVQPVQLPQAMSEFRTWLKQWQGNLIACTSSLDFWHLFNAMFMTGKDCPFGSAPLDTNSYGAGLVGKKTPQRLQGSIVPLEVAQERWGLVTEGKLPVFGTPKTKGAPKAVRAGNSYRFLDSIRVETSRQPAAAPAWQASTLGMEANGANIRYNNVPVSETTSTPFSREILPGETARAYALRMDQLALDQRLAEDRTMTARMQLQPEPPSQGGTISLEQAARLFRSAR